MQNSTFKTPEDFPLILKMSHVIEITGLSKEMAYRLPHQKGFPVIRFGKAIRIPRDAFFSWLGQQAGGG